MYSTHVPSCSHLLINERLICFYIKKYVTKKVCVIRINGVILRAGENKLDVNTLNQHTVMRRSPNTNFYLDFYSAQARNVFAVYKHPRQRDENVCDETDIYI